MVSALMYFGDKTKEKSAIKFGRMAFHKEKVGIYKNQGNKTDGDTNILNTNSTRISWERTLCQSLHGIYPVYQYIPSDRESCKNAYNDRKKSR